LLNFAGYAGAIRKMMVLEEVRKNVRTCRLCGRPSGS
jgi:hypothetical protein